MFQHSQDETNAKKPSATLLAAMFLLALSFLGSAWLLREGLLAFRMSDRSVTVRGLATREVEADLAVWPIKFSATDNDLQKAREQLERDAKEIRAFLEGQGLRPENVEVLNIESQDLLAQSYRPEGVSQGRYLLTQSFVVRTTDIQAVVRGAQNISQLLAQNVVLTNSAAPTYLFTKLNEIKPPMIAEATKNARAGAEQFAADSGQKIGAIRAASQGYFEIQPRDPVSDIPESAQRYKTVRVVTNIDYYLE